MYIQLKPILVVKCCEIFLGLELLFLFPWDRTTLFFKTRSSLINFYIFVYK